MKDKVIDNIMSSKIIEEIMNKHLAIKDVIFHKKFLSILSNLIDEKNDIPFTRRCFKYFNYLLQTYTPIKKNVYSLIYDFIVKSSDYEGFMKEIYKFAYHDLIHDINNEILKEISCILCCVIA